MSEAKSLKADLLIELGCEELPPKSLSLLTESFFRGVCEGLEEAGIAFVAEESTCFFTPRRMTLHLCQVDGHQPDRSQDRKGPAVAAAYDGEGNPTPAATGFARSVGREVSELETLSTDKGEWLFCRVEIAGQALDELLFPIMQNALDHLPVPKPMRWSDHDFRFVRPVHWLLVLHGNRVVEGELFGCQAGNQTRGHRIHSPGPHVIDAPGDYLEVLRKARVEADHRLRRETIRDQVTRAGQSTGGHARISEELLNEVTNLVEWPVAVHCQFETAFLEVPREALIASMENHQKFFPVLDSDNHGLSPDFVVIANIESINTQAVQEGFERVIRPRLADAQFFWEQDLRTPLQDSLPALDKVVFQKDLGTIGDKSRRIQSLSKNLEEINGIEDGSAEQAALLSKCDLVSLMVGEFPELQGTMGAYYALASGQPESVARAIDEHYRPRYSGDEIPQGPAGQVVSLADRMDTLVGVFAAGLKPTGNKDPYALRRAALGVIRILLEGPVHIELSELIKLAAGELSKQITVSADVEADVLQFMLDRLNQYLRSDRNASSLQVKAVLAAELGTLSDLDSRLNALSSFMQRDEADSLVAANKRISNILKKSELATSGEIDAKLLNMSQEVALFDEITEIAVEVGDYFRSGDYDQALTRLAALKGPVDDFFDHVMVMDEDQAVQQNRINLLSLVKSQFDRVADFSLAG